MFCWVYFLKLKFEVFETLKVWKSLVENQCGNKIKVIHTNNGKEYVKNSLHHLCEECGIQMHHSVPNTPQKKWCGREEEHGAQGDDNLYD